MALFGSRLRAVPFVDENIGGGFMEDQRVPTQNDLLKAEAMKNVPRRRGGLFGGGRGAEAMMVLGAALRGGDDMPAVMELIGGAREAERAAAQQEALMAQADSLGLTPRERFLLSIDPKNAAQLLREQMSPYTLAQGARRRDPTTGMDDYNAETGVDGGFAYTFDEDGNIIWGNQRPMSHSEETARTLGQERVDAMRDRYEALERQADERIGLSRQREGRIARGGGSSGGGGGGSRSKLPPGFILD